MTAEGLVYAYNKLYQFLNLKNKPDLGLTIIVTPQWMFVATIYDAYHVENFRNDRDFPVYLDGFAYAGILNLQTVSKKWPATASSATLEHLPLTALKTQAS
jgi:hypothetical protein